MKLEHFSHEHPLILLDEEQQKKVGFCDGCSELIYGVPSYNCSHVHVGCDFNLHKYCAELPRKIQQHPLHPQHPLTLFPKSPYGHWEFNCSKCKLELKNFTYHCSVCDFDLDVRCAFPMLVINIEHKSHTHPLVPLTQEVSLVCDACGNKHQGKFYTCPTCIQYHDQFFIHKDCLLLPPTLKHSGHDCIVKLAYSVPPNYSQFYLECNICSKELLPKFWVYYCDGCRYFAHVNCATTLKEETAQTKPDEDFVLESIHLPVPECVSLISHFLKNTKLEEAEREKTIELDHFSHEHPLTFFDVQSEDEELRYGTKLCQVNEIKDEKICSGCIQQISNSPFYSCAQCKFFLHKYCSELPTIVQHPCDSQHSLILIPKASTPLGLFLCKCCNRYCNGFAYHCASCNLYLDVKCGLLPSAITHESHPQHTLKFKKESSFIPCKLCGWVRNYPLAFECSSCNFKLHSRCALLPSLIRQRYDDLHPFTLTYSPIKDHPQEYICEVCEKDLNPAIWFYHCIDCDKSIHIYCTLGADESYNIKFGGIFNTDYHEHQLTLVQKTKEPSVCDMCTENIECDFVFHAHSTLECSECHFKIHVRCGLQK